MDPAAIFGAAGLAYGSNISSFSEHLRSIAPELLPAHRANPTRETAIAELAPHGTTIVAITFGGGVLIAGDRRATAGHLIANRDIEKVYVTDEFSAAGIAGTAGLAVEMVRLFAVELEHYEKIEGVSLTFDGKASRLASMVRANLPAAMQGLVVVPLLVGYDHHAETADRAGRIVSFDVVGGRSEERAGYHSVGSGSNFARTSLKKSYRRGMTSDEALTIAFEALYDAADDDSATGGPDAARRIYPTAILIDSTGAQQISEDQAQGITQAITDARRQGGE